MKELFKAASTTHLRFPFTKRIHEAYRAFSPTERVLFLALAILFIASSIRLVALANDAFKVTIPARGGSLSEGIVGYPRFLNPILSYLDSTRDMNALLYSGLMRARPDGTLVGDLASSYDISEDGKTYTFFLRPNATFHDGTPVTADDVEFTIKKALDPIIKSPVRTNWEGVTIEKVSDHQIQFILRQPYAPFLENTTLGILPKHIWDNLASEEFSFSQYNIEPIGSGPYRVKNIVHDEGGLPISYTLTGFEGYTLGEPLLRTVMVRFYPNEDALLAAFRKGEIETIHGISPEKLATVSSENSMILQTPLPRVFGVFFNQNQSKVLRQLEVRKALELALDRSEIIENVFHGYATELTSPIPPTLFGGRPATSSLSQGATALGTSTLQQGKVVARALLEKNGWKLRSDGVYEKKIGQEAVPLSFSIETSNARELREVADSLKSQWAAIGVNTMVKIYEPGDLNQNVIRPRRYDALLFGEIVGRDLDLFAFWHSSQRNDPGLNIALYANSRADKLLEEARQMSNFSTRVEKLRAFETEVANDRPALFLYSPQFTYVVPERVRGIELGTITAPSERFLTVHEWYTDLDSVWGFSPGTLHQAK